MSINVNQYALVSLAEVKNFIDMIVSNSETDDLLSNLINRYSILFENYMNRDILSREYTQYYDGGGHDMLFLNQYPITTISGIWDDSDWEWNSTTEVDSTSYRVSDEASGIINFRYTTLGDYIENIKIIYTAGYSSVPEDIKLSCIKEVARSYKGRNEVGVVSKTLADGSVSYTAQGLMVETTLVLDMYKRLWVI